MHGPTYIKFSVLRSGHFLSHSAQFGVHCHTFTGHWTVCTVTSVGGVGKRTRERKQVLTLQTASPLSQTIKWSTVAACCRWQLSRCPSHGVTSLQPALDRNQWLSPRNLVAIIYTAWLGNERPSVLVTPQCTVRCGGGTVPPSPPHLLSRPTELYHLKYFMPKTVSSGLKIQDDIVFCFSVPRVERCIC